MAAPDVCKVGGTMDNVRKLGRCSLVNGQWAMGNDGHSKCVVGGMGLIGDRGQLSIVNVVH